MLDFLLLPTSRTYWHDHVQALNPWTPSFLNSPPNTSTPACVFFKFQWQQLEWSSRCRKFFSLKILSLCEGKHLKDLTRDSHKPQYEQHKNVARVYLLYLGQIRNPKRFKSLRAELEILQKKNVRPDFRLIEPKLRSIEKGWNSFFKSCNSLIQLYNNEPTLSKSKTT